MKAVIYTRVSKNVQSDERQVSELEEYAKGKDWEVLGVFREKISGAKKNVDRPVLQEAKELCKKHKAKFVVWDVSRLGRNTLEGLKTLEELTESKVSVYVKTLGIETLNPNGTPNQAGRLVITIMFDLAQSERENLIERINSGLQEAKRKGKKLGRAKGTTDSKTDTLAKHPKVVKLLKKGESVRNTAKIVGCSTATVQKVKKLLN